MSSSLLHQMTQFLFPAAAPRVQVSLPSAVLPMAADVAVAGSTRRGFLTAIAAGAVATALPRRGEAQSVSQEAAPPRAAPVPSEGADRYVLSLVPEPFSYGETLLETALLELPIRGVDRLFRAMGVPTGNEAAAEIMEEPREGSERVSPGKTREFAGDMRSEMWKIYIATGLLFPLGEETVRAVPAWFLNYTGEGRLLFKSTLGETRWDWGGITSLGFALMHCKEFKYVPVTQFFSGFWYWFLARRRGFDHAVLAHSANNIISLYQLSRMLHEAVVAEEEVEPEEG